MIGDVGSLVIRPAAVPDAPAAARARVDAMRASYRGLMSDAVLDRPDFEREQTSELTAGLTNLSETVRVSVAELDGAVVGYASYGVDREAKGGRYDLFVHPDYWHRGIGRALLASAEGFLRRSGSGTAVLFVVEGNTRARAVYERAGWVADGHMEVDKRSGLPVVRYGASWPAQAEGDIS